MIQPGLIKITDKVIFEYRILDEPCFSDFEAKYGEGYTTITYFQKALKEYEAYKESVEVSNVNKVKKEWVLKRRSYFDKIIKNNQKCKVEITGGTCIIIKLL